MFHGVGNSFPILERSHFAEVTSKHIGILEDPQGWLEKREGRGLCMLVCLSIHFILTENMLKSACEAPQTCQTLKDIKKQKKHANTDIHKTRFSLVHSCSHAGVAQTKMYGHCHHCRTRESLLSDRPVHGVSLSFEVALAVWDFSLQAQ